jgi:hypothetical protein
MVTKRPAVTPFGISGMAITRPTISQDDRKVKKRHAPMMFTTDENVRIWRISKITPD